MTAPLVDANGLTIRDAQGNPVVDGVALSVGRGATIGIVGESGSGKTTLALALMGLVRPGLELAGGEVRVGGDPILPASAGDVSRLRRRVVSYLGQDPAGSLTPSMRVGRQIAERLREPPARRAEREAVVAERLAAVGLPRERDFQRRFPGQLSGGQQQRVALARALAGDPQVLVLDEPTTGLDVVTQDLVLAEIARQRTRLGLALVVISHDLAIVARLADDVLVMQDGACVDRGAVVALLTHPSHPHTAELVAACPDVQAGVTAMTPPATHGQVALLEVASLRAVHGRRARRVVAVDGVSLSVAHGECLALVGSSGSGKTTIARCVAGLHGHEAGTIALDGVALRSEVWRRTAEQQRRVQLIAQDPYGSLNPRRRAGDSIARPLRVIHGLGADAARGRVTDLLERVRLAPALAERYPSELSGGQRQRVAIARALAAEPDLLVCDEIASALDTSVQATILDVLDELRRELGLGVLFVTHDLGIVARVADRVAVLDRGRVVEHGAAGDVLTSPADERTRVLLAASRSLSAELGARAARA